MTRSAVPCPVRRFRKKPVTIEAIRWNGSNRGEVAAFLGVPYQPHGSETDKVVINTLEGSMTAAVGDWIIRGVQGEFYPCKPNIFEATYEPVDGPRQSQ